MKHAKRVQKESSSNTVKKESLKSHTEVIAGALAIVKSQIEAMMEPPEDVLGVQFKPFGPLDPPDTVVEAREVVFGMYNAALGTKYYAMGDLVSLIECAKFHPGLRPELDALRALVEGMKFISELPDEETGNESPLSEIEQRLTMEVRRLEETSDDSTEAVLKLFYSGGYKDLLKDVPSASETADAVQGIMRAQKVMNSLAMWRNAQ